MEKIFGMPIEKKIEFKELCKYPWKRRKGWICFFFGHKYVPDGEPFNTMSLGIPMQSVICQRCGKGGYEALVD